MDIIGVTRSMEQHRAHTYRIRNMEGTIDTTTPKSLGLKHLASRPKKQQLIDDRQAAIAKENKKLMERMTKIMCETRPQKKHVKGATHAFNKLEVDRLNLENSLLSHRLKFVAPAIDVKKMEDDFTRHLTIGAHLRRRQIKPLNLNDTSNSRNQKQQNIYQPEGSFDSNAYMSHQSSAVLMNTDGSTVLGDAPIKNMSDFRKQVLSSKKMPNGFIPRQEIEPLNNNSKNDTVNSKYEYTHNP